MASHKLFILLLSLLLAVGISYAYVCTSNYCSKNPCTVDVNCQSKNNSRTIKNGGSCGCCDLCIIQLDLGDNCNPELVAIPSSECGAGLTCNETTQMCEYRTASQCTDEQVTYDGLRNDGAILPGKTRPVCDYWGYYDSVRCIEGSVCFCVNKIGERIFGTDFIGQKNQIMCNCSRDADFLTKSLASTKAFTYGSEDYAVTVPFAHCLPNGNYDPLQCINGNCFCLSKDIKLASSIASESIKETLVCYDPAYHQESYIRWCEKERDQKLYTMVNSSMNNAEVYGVDVPLCDLDGSYAAVQCTEDYCYCAHKYNGSQIESYRVDRYSVDAEQMSCYCARDRMFVTDPVFKDQYRCDHKGDYEPKQCQGNLCYCVDPSGVQTGIELPRRDSSSLNCTFDDSAIILIQ